MPNTKAFLGAGRVAPAAGPGSGGPDYHHMQGLARGLAVLRTLNQAPRGQLFITEIARLTSLHRTTVKRILETLATEGYVQRSPIDDSYRLTLRIRDSGTHAIALPILRMGEPVGCLNIVFFRKAMSIEQAAETWLPALRTAVGRIEAKLAEPSGVLPAE